MSRKGDCWDNAVAESFFSTLFFEVERDARWYDVHDVNRGISSSTSTTSTTRRGGIHTIAISAPLTSSVGSYKKRRGVVLLSTKAGQAQTDAGKR